MLYTIIESCIRCVEHVLQHKYSQLRLKNSCTIQYTLLWGIPCNVFRDNPLSLNINTLFVTAYHLSYIYIYKQFLVILSAVLMLFSIKIECHSIGGTKCCDISRSCTVLVLPDTVLLVTHNSVLMPVPFPLYSRYTSWGKNDKSAQPMLFRMTGICLREFIRGLL